ncbi:MAG: tRNA (adenine(22)-N(1))-methyltransferase [Acutalibacteraceae bacterium]
MKNIRLDSRLACVASLVKKSDCVIDVGTDHAYLPAFLLQNKVCQSAYACDVKKGPLENARETIKNCGLEKKIETVLSDGLDSVTPQKNCCVVLAGMGGILISEILMRAKWLLDESIQIVAQPMSHAEQVRKFFFENGFEITEEKTVADSRHVYLALTAVYTGERTEYTEGQLYYGKLFENEGETTHLYLKRQYDRLKKRYDAICSDENYQEEILTLKAILNEFHEKGRTFDADR